MNLLCMVCTNLPLNLRSLIWLLMMVWSKRGNINRAALVTIAQCNTLVAPWSVEWFWWDWSLSLWPTGFLQCFDADGWVIWPVQIVPEMTYKVSSGTLNLCSLTVYKSSFCVFFMLQMCILFVLRLYQKHEMQTIVTDVCGVCLSVCHAA